jgi:hypothetical protein
MVIGVTDARVSFHIKVGRPDCQRLLLIIMLLWQRGLAVRDMGDPRLGDLTHDLTVFGVDADEGLRLLKRQGA